MLLLALLFTFREILASAKKSLEGGGRGVNMFNTVSHFLFLDTKEIHFYSLAGCQGCNLLLLAVPSSDF